MSSLGAPGARFIGNKTDDWIKFLIYLSEKYDVDKEEIMVGVGSIPPSDPVCLVYASISHACLVEYFRKGLKPNGRWVCWNYLSEEIGESSQKGTYDYRKSCMYRV